MRDAAPVAPADRIESLDVLRGFAVLGILLLNILGFGLPMAAYSSPGQAMETAADLVAWAGVELFAEGAMRCLFSILFGAGVALFTTGATAKGAGLHFRRNFWLLALGLFDAYLLLWNGDILINYALAGFLLYTVRNLSARRLIVAAGVFVVLMSALHGLMNVGLSQSRAAAQQIEAAEHPETLPAEVREMAAGWQAFMEDYQPSQASIDEELQARRGSYLSALRWNVGVTNEMLLFVMPLFLFWDALAMMLLGMGLYKLGILQGQRSRWFYARLAVAGFALGLSVNGYEVYRAMQSDFDLLSTFAQMQVTYHFGRLGMALGWMGLVLWWLQGPVWTSVRFRLACVGRMALTNYLSHSLICLLLFTGAGFGLVGTLERAQVYVVVLGIWLFQLWFSPWWLARNQYGPLEWLWRALTYGRAFPIRRTVELRRPAE